MTTTVTVRRRLTPEDRAASPYLELPFEVPSRTPPVEVRLRYDRTAGVVDLGCWGPSGFRGWSGGARDRFVITPAAATPGYLPESARDAYLEPGTWAVLLGLRIARHRRETAGDISA